MIRLKHIGIAFGGTAILLGAPIIPSQMQYVGGWQTPYDAQFPSLAASTTPPASPKVYPDDDGNGIVSVAVFEDRAGNQVFVQIPDAKYDDGATVGGHDRNPTNAEYISIFEALATPAVAAIATSNQASATGAAGTSVTLSFNMTGSTNTLLLTHVANASGTGASGCTWNGSAMTRVDTEQTDSAAEKTTMFAFVGATGTQNIVCSWGVSAFGIFVATSYTGVNQSVTPDTSNHANSGVNQTTLVTTTNPVGSNNCWTFLTVMSSNKAPTAGTGATLRQVGSNIIISAFDSNAIVSSGSVSMTVNGGAAATEYTSVIASYCEPAAASTPPTNDDSQWFNVL